MISLREAERLAQESQRRADERRAAEVSARDELPWMIGLALLAVLAICAFVLAGFGVLA